MVIINSSVSVCVCDFFLLVFLEFRCDFSILHDVSSQFQSETIEFSFSIKLDSSPFFILYNKRQFSIKLMRLSSLARPFESESHSAIYLLW